MILRKKLVNKVEKCYDRTQGDDSMRKENILKFAMHIISNGVEQNLSIKEIRNSLEDYAVYLQEQAFADLDTLEDLKKLDSALPAITKIIKTCGPDNLASFLVHLQSEDHASVRRTEPLRSSFESCGTSAVCGGSRVSSSNSCGDSRIDTRYSCGRSTVSSCGSSLVKSVASCGSSRSRRHC